jgi:hypothetical protein
MSTQIKGTPTNTANEAVVLNASIGILGSAEKIELEYATELRRDSPLVASMKGALALTDEQLDQLFISAGAL